MGFSLLLENDSKVLLESGDAILLEGVSVVTGFDGAYPDPFGSTVAIAPDPFGSTAKLKGN
jgi:hypothetical protein